MSGTAPEQGSTVRTISRVLCAAVLSLAFGCVKTPRILLTEEQHIIDRAAVEYPTGYELRRYVTGFVCPTAVCFDADGVAYVAQGQRGDEPVIWRIAPNDTRVTKFYPHETAIIPGQDLFHRQWKMYGPVGGMAFVEGKIIVTHRDEQGLGVVTALDFKGGHKTLCAGFPTQGDNGLTDLAYDPRSKRLWFACGSVTNSGVVGLDNYQIGWVREHPELHDVPFHDTVLLGQRFQTNNPMAGLFGPADIAVTGGLQAFNQGNLTRIKGSTEGKPSAAIFSVPLEGGFAQVEADGVHLACGIAFNEFGTPYIVNRGMEMREGSTRPIRDDPDVLLRLPPGVPFLGWPDYTADFRPVGDPRSQPPTRMIEQTGYQQVLPMIDMKASGLTAPVADTMLEVAFPSLSGANKLAFAPWKEFEGQAIVTLSGDRSPYASGGITLPHSQGFKVVRVDIDRHVVRDFVRNVGDRPASQSAGGNRDLIERPIDVKFAPDGTLYILDAGRMNINHGREQYDPDSKFNGQLYRLAPIRKPASTSAPSGR